LFDKLSICSKIFIKINQNVGWFEKPLKESIGIADFMILYFALTWTLFLSLASIFFQQKKNAHFVHLS